MLLLANYGITLITVKMRQLRSPRGWFGVQGDGVFIVSDKMGTGKKQF